MFLCATRADQKSSLEDWMAWLRRKKNKRWYYGMDPSPFPQKMRAGLHALYSSTAAAFVRCHEVEQMARLGGSWAVLSSRPAAMPHHAPNTQSWRWGRGGGRKKGWIIGYWRPYRGFWPVNMRNPSYSRAGRVWLTVVQYWLAKGLDRRLTLGRLKACSKGLVLNVMFMQYSVEKNTGMQHTRAF